MDTILPERFEYRRPILPLVDPLRASPPTGACLRRGWPSVREVGRHDVTQRPRRRAGEILHGTRDGAEQALSRRRREARDDAGDELGHPALDHPGDQRIVVDVDDLHGAPAQLGRERGELLRPNGVGTGDVVRPTLVTVLYERRGGRRSAVLA